MCKHNSWYAHIIANTKIFLRYVILSQCRFFQLTKFQIYVVDESPALCLSIVDFDCFNKSGKYNFLGNCNHEGLRIASVCLTQRLDVS